jgi:hypothetical protein
MDGYGKPDIITGIRWSAVGKYVDSLKPINFISTIALLFFNCYFKN